MILTFLGTGPAIAIPRKGCQCRVCRKGGKSRRTRSSALVTYGNTNLLIDAGPDIGAQLRRGKVKRIDAVFLTHAHADAAGGVKQLDRWISEHQKGEPVTVYAEQQTIRRIVRRWKNLPSLTFRSIKPLLRITVGGVRITPFRVSHSMTPGFPTLGFRIGKNLAYASDVSALPKASKDLVRGTGTLVLDGAMYLKRHIASHLSADQSIRIATDLKAKKLILMQIGHSYPPHEQAEKKLRALARSKGLKHPASVRLAYDGMKIKLR